MSGGSLPYLRNRCNLRLHFVGFAGQNPRAQEPSKMKEPKKNPRNARNPRFMFSV
jgi:hypothetical protein